MRRIRAPARARRAARQPRRRRPSRDELAPPHSITSSARASTRRRHVEAERLGGLEVDDQLEFGRRLHWQVGGLLALEDAIDVAGSQPELVDLIGSVGHQSARPAKKRSG